MNVTVECAQAAVGGFWTPQVFAAMIQGGAALIAAGVVGVFAWQQWITARGKLTFDLFDRRFKSYQEIREAIDARISEITSMDFESAMSGNYPALRSFWRAQENARLLFGNDVQEILKQTARYLDQIEETRRAEFLSNPEWRGYNDVPLVILTDRHGLALACDRYMNLGKIAVSSKRVRRNRPFAGNEGAKLPK